MPKRAALLLDRIMVALQKAVDEESGIGPGKDRLPLEDTVRISLEVI